jgi:hypothetical protein
MAATSKEEVKTIGNSKFSSKLKGLKFMQRAQEKKTSDDEKATTTTTSLTTARTTTTTTTTKATTLSNNKNDDEHWTYENPEEYERARKQAARLCAREEENIEHAVGIRSSKFRRLQQSHRSHGERAARENEEGEISDSRRSNK